LTELLDLNVNVNVKMGVSEDVILILSYLKKKCCCSISLSLLEMRSGVSGERLGLFANRILYIFDAVDGKKGLVMI